MMTNQLMARTLMVLGLQVLSLQAAHAGTMGGSPREYHPLATLTLGPNFINKTNAQTLTLLPPFQQRYTVDSGSPALDIGGFLGVERTISERLFIQLGLSVYGDINYQIQGHVWKFARPQFANVGYSYDVYPLRVLVTNKILTLLSNHPSIHPYFSYELGVAFNQAAHYEEHPLIPQAFTMAPYANHGTTSFTYGVGLGFDYSLNQRIRAGVGYQFADLGAASLGKSSAQSTNQTPGMNHLYSNQLRFQLTVLI